MFLSALFPPTFYGEVRMAEKSRDPQIVALESVYAALKDLDAPVRKKVLSSVFALLELEPPPQANGGTSGTGSPPVEVKQHNLSSRPISLVELINEKKPASNYQRIALFAYYREKSENLTRFGRDDLKPYFGKAKEPPSANYDRDFVEAVRKGWIHEDQADSYLTTKGIEAVEAGFEGERKSPNGPKAGSRGKRNKRGSRSQSGGKRRTS